MAKPQAPNNQKNQNNDKATSEASQSTGGPNPPSTHPNDGPLSIAGVEASDLPGGGRGSVETDRGKESARKLPQNTGGVLGGDVGLHGTPDIAEADQHGGRGKN